MTPPALRRWRGPETALMRCPDGVQLATDIYRPEAPGPHPVLLMRQPYGRRIASAVVFAHPAWYAAQGYIVAVQDARGRGDSEGTFRLFADDVDDGATALAWAADLPGASGKVGMYGFSYQGTNQFLAMAGARARGGKRPDAIAPTMAAWSIRDDWAYDGRRVPARRQYRLGLPDGGRAGAARRRCGSLHGARHDGTRNTLERREARPAGRAGALPGLRALRRLAGG